MFEEIFICKAVKIILKLFNTMYDSLKAHNQIFEKFNAANYAMFRKKNLLIPPNYDYELNKINFIRY